MNALPFGANCATLLTRVEVDHDDPAFLTPTKAIGPVYTSEQARAVLADHNWPMIDTGAGMRRVVASPLPKNILGLHAIRLLVEAGVCVICASGGGIPMMSKPDGGMEGVEVVIDKDRTAALLATELQADALLMLTDVEAIFANWGSPEQAAILDITPDALELMVFDAGSMAPKVASACSFVRAGGALAGVGRLSDARAILEGRAGTRIAAPALGVTHAIIDDRKPA